MSRSVRLALALAAGALLFSACAKKAEVLPSGRFLELRCDPASPAELPSGKLVEIKAVPVPQAEMQWVSGTVKLFGAPNIVFKKDPKDGNFRFRTMVPPMVEVPIGKYAIKVWGRTTAGEAVEGHMDYEVR